MGEDAWLEMAYEDRHYVPDDELWSEQDECEHDAVSEHTGVCLDCRVYVGA